MNYFILLIAKVFVFPSVSDKDSVLQNCWKKSIGIFLPIRTWKALVSLQTWMKFSYILHCELENLSLAEKIC